MLLAPAMAVLILMGGPAKTNYAVWLLTNAGSTVITIWYLLIVGHILKSALDTGLVTGFAVAVTWAIASLAISQKLFRGSRLMHLHIIGICGTFMGGIAALARAAGHRVTGSDANVYPPMSTQLEALGIALIDGYDPAQLDLKPDVVLVGNVMSRGNPLIERLLDSGLPFTSGPQWLAENVLQQPRGRGRRRHSRQDHDVRDTRLDPARSGARSGLPDRRHPGELRHVGARGKGRGLRDRGR